MIYSNSECNQFAFDMRRNGYDVVHYMGRLLYEGPAVRVRANSVERVRRMTSVMIQHYVLHNDMVMLYPVVNGNQVKGVIT